MFLKVLFALNTIPLAVFRCILSDEVHLDFPLILHMFFEVATLIMTYVVCPGFDKVMAIQISATSGKSNVDEIDERKLADEGMLSINDQKYDEAIDIFDRLITKNNAEPEYFILRGKCHSKLGRKYEAVSDFQEALRMDVNDYQRLPIFIALANMQVFDVPKKEINKLNFDDKLKLVDEWCSLKKFDKALAFYDTLIKTSEGLFKEKSYTWRGYCYMKMEDENSALSDFDEASKIRIIRYPLGPNVKKILFIVGLFDCGKIEEAKKEMRALDSAEYGTLAMELIRKEKFEEISVCFDEAAKNYPKNADITLWRAYYLKEIGKIEEALIYYYKAVEENPSEKSLALELQHQLREAGQLDEARKVLQDYDAKFPDTSTSEVGTNSSINEWISLGEKFFEEGRETEARQILHNVDEALQNSRTNDDDPFINRERIETFRKKIIGKN